MMKRNRKRERTDKINDYKKKKEKRKMIRDRRDKVKD